MLSKFKFNFFINFVRTNIVHVLIELNSIKLTSKLTISNSVISIGVSLVYQLTRIAVNFPITGSHRLREILYNQKSAPPPIEFTR